MDKQTIQAYNATASETADFHSILVPEKIYQLIQKYFIKDSMVIDIGCGVGRDCQWLFDHGYMVNGIDASEGMLNQARKRYPQIDFSNDNLPLLKTIRSNEYANVLCSAVIMHLDDNQIKIAIENLIRITSINGRMILSYRSTEQINQRENGKLYTDINTDDLVSLFSNLGAELLLSETDYDSIRKILWTNLVFKKLQCR